MYPLRFLDRVRVIMGGGPLGSSLARLFAEAGKEVTVVHDKNDLGSHQDKSRLARLALESSEAEYAVSKDAIAKLVDLQKRVPNKIITAKPGLLFFTPNNSAQAALLAQRAESDPQLKRYTSEAFGDLHTLFPIGKYPNMEIWYHPEAYVINPVALSQANLAMAARQGAEILNGRATIHYPENSYLISTDTGYHISTSSLYLLTGAQNKFNSRYLGFAAPAFNNTYLTGISTQRYTLAFSGNKPMPITVGEVRLPDREEPISFSTMPESTTTIKVRVSGLGQSEVIQSVEDKLNLDTHGIKKLYSEVTGSLFPFLKAPYDFKRCVTYRNTHPDVDAFSYLNIINAHGKHGTLSVTGSTQLVTTLGCYGVHVKYGEVVAQAMQQTDLLNNPQAALQHSSLRVTQIDYFKQLFPEAKQFLQRSKITQMIGRTALKQIAANVYLKQEGDNLTGSIKDRTAFYLLIKLIATGQLKSHDTIVTATSGNYGRSLYEIKKLIEQHSMVRFNLIIVAPAAYQNRECFQKLKRTGITLVNQHDFSFDKFINSDALFFCEGNFVNAITIARDLATQPHVHFIDQQYDIKHVHAHETTARELMEQLPEVTDIVTTVGTGATATGIRHFFEQQHKPVRVHAMPAKSGTIPGLTNPVIYNNYFKQHGFFSYNKGILDHQQAMQRRASFETATGLKVGESTGAALNIADQVRKDNPNAIIAVISPSNS